MPDISPAEQPGSKPLPNKVFQVDYSQLTAFAQRHDLNAEDIRAWAQANPDFPARFLETHGKVAYATYLQVLAHMEGRNQQGQAFAARHDSTAASLRNAVRIISAVDSNAAATLAPPSSS